MVDEFKEAMRYAVASWCLPFGTCIDQFTTQTKFLCSAPEVSVRSWRYGWGLSEVSRSPGVVPCNVDKRVGRLNWPIGRENTLVSRQDVFPLGQELIKTVQFQKHARHTCCWGPLFHLLRVGSGLCVIDGGTVETGGFTGDWVITFGVGKVIVVEQPQTGAGTGGTSCRCDACLVYIPLSCLATDKLQGTGRIIQGSFDGWFQTVGLVYITIVNCHYGNTRFQQGRCIDKTIKPFLASAFPAAP